MLATPFPPLLDPLQLALALGPMAVYLVLLGIIHLARRPLLTTGARDAAALGVAISGFVAVGPMQLFLPETAVVRWGALYVWPLLLVFYALCLTLVILLMRPRLVIYNIRAERLRPILADVVTRLDNQARWAGESLVLPQLGVQLHVEPFDALRSTQLVSAGPSQDYHGWQRLERALAEQLAQSAPAQRSPLGAAFVLAGLLLGVALTAWMIHDPQVVNESLRDLLRL